MTALQLSLISSAIILMILTINFFPAASGAVQIRKGSHKSAKTAFPNRRNKQRTALIISCCGEKSCTNMTRNTRATTIQTRTETTQNSPPMEISSTSDSISTLQETNIAAEVITEAVNNTLNVSREELIYPNCDTSTQLNAAAFDAAGNLLDPEDYGFWVQSCDQLFLLGKTLVDWRENLATCRKIGMEPLMLESANKLDCFKSLVQDWKFSSNYWSAGFRVDNVSDQFSWCSKTGAISLNNSELMPWGANQPENASLKQHCLRLKVLKTDKTFFLFDETCGKPQMLGCQGKPTPAPPCGSPSCPNMTYCLRNDQLFSGLGILNNPDLHGNWFSIYGRNYIFSFQNDTKNFTEAFYSCCGLGMKLLSLEFDFKYKSVIEALKANITTEDYFWTSGSDHGCESKYSYCSVKRSLRKEAIWAPGQPDNWNNNENGIAVSVNSSHALLWDFNEETKFRYICEARDTSANKSGGTAARDECASIYNISQTEIDGVLNLTSYDVRIKCFLKCVGESSGLMVSGKFIDNEVLAILETLAGNDTEGLKKNMGELEECKRYASAGMDECDKAALMIQCANEKEPEVVNSVIKEMDQVLTAQRGKRGGGGGGGGIPVLAEAFCYNSSACQVNPLRFLHAGHGLPEAGSTVRTTLVGALRTPPST
ncbi:uncharacterized protein LOC132193896 isoform X2 [Neocloeon triangulifer]|uniref:uncharacterized protein LOC132193896 isoform X2 n=1 Tax=Neocloeon triangulifer TaxID=2078957 RepID=UPI00286EBA7A|nr:uncharacterized protein LOC132193896 isoform X2 [Neocloeon triangulifer]